MPRTFHVLTESEPFSDRRGGAVSRWVANVVRSDEGAIVIAPSADGSWQLPKDQVQITTRLRLYKRLNDMAGTLLRWPIRKVLVRFILNSALRRVVSGDTVWVHNRPEFAAAIAPIVRDRGARLVLHLHNSHLVEWPSVWMRAINADRYVFLTHFIEQEAVESIPDLGHTAVSYSGADQRIFFPDSKVVEQSTPVVLFVGRLVPEKGVHVLIQAMQLLQRRNVPIYCVILGSSGFGDLDKTAYVQQLESSAPENTRFEPYCSGEALGQRFRDADIFCAPSVWQEALGLVVVEAMASGLPVVASRSGGIPEMLAGGGGILVERNSATELADALELLAANGPLRRRLGQEAYASFRKSFTWDVVRENYHGILASMEPEDASSGQREDNADKPKMQEAECSTFQTSA